MRIKWNEFQCIPSETYHRVISPTMYGIEKSRDDEFRDVLKKAQVANGLQDGPPEHFSLCVIF